MNKQDRIFVRDKRPTTLLVLVGAFFIVALAGCVSTLEVGLSKQTDTNRLESEIPACNVARSDQSVNCVPRDVGTATMLQPRAEGAMFDYRVPSTEEVLENGMFAAGASPSHIALRGAARKGSVRCDWRDVARTSEQREASVRYWLGFEKDQELPSPARLEATSTPTPTPAPTPVPGGVAVTAQRSADGTSVDVSWTNSRCPASTTTAS